MNATQNAPTIFLVEAVMVIGAVSPAFGQTAPKVPAEAIRFFEARVRPILVEHCIRCHGPAKQRGRPRHPAESEKPVGVGPTEAERWLAAFGELERDPAWDELFGPFDEGAGI